MVQDEDNKVQRAIIIGYKNMSPKARQVRWFVVGFDDNY